ncbi:hypothetical protein GCM10009104_01390 [Marinobacterium maritimum]|uniref:Cell division protein FtsL n=2 Tax=Marinobacterium maritimum TaxID=500162 RepID=A0ABP3T5Y8_9GAMM
MKLPRFKVKRPDVGSWAQALKAKLPQVRPARKDTMQPSRMLSGSEVFVPAATSLLLTLMVMGSAMAVIFSAYEYRRLFNQHQVLVQQWDDLQVEWGQYLLEQSVWSAHHRVEAVAADKMNMVVPATEAIEIVRNEQR